ncbi:MAG: glutaredoxin family protein [Thiobacillaceae bacterium]
MSANPPELTLYGRTGCHLCEAMEAELAPHLKQNGLRLMQIDISGQPGLEDCYGLDIPVLTHGKEEICRHFFDLERFQTWLSEFGPIR